jgi:hypothetical protein
MSKTIKINKINKNDTKINTDLATKISNLFDHGRKEITIDAKKNSKNFRLVQLFHT